MAVSFSTASSSNSKQSGTSKAFPPDLQTVYKRVIRAEESRVTPSQRSTSSAIINSSDYSSSNSKSDLTIAMTGRHSGNQWRISENRPQPPSPAEEIIIKPLPFHSRERPLTSGATSDPSTKYHLGNVTAVKAAEHAPSNRPDMRQAEPGYLSRSRAAELLWSSGYSDQSIRYVTEQVALEQARQRKRLSGVQGHRIDRKYYVNGSGLSVDQPFQSRVTSAFLSRLNQRNQLSRNHLFRYSYQPKSQAELMVSGHARVRQNSHITADAGLAADNTSNSGSAVSPVRPCDSESLLNSDSVSESRTERTVSPAKGEASYNGEPAKPRDKTTLSVTFILPSEDSSTES